MGRRTGIFAFALALGCDAPATVEPAAGATGGRTARSLDRTAAAMLAHVPADTPYVFMAAEPLPAGYVKRIEPLVDATLAAWDRALAGPIPSRDPETIALYSSLRGHLSAEGLRELGFATNPHWVFYGFGLVPVLRLELADGRKFAELVTRIDGADGSLRGRTELGHALWTLGGPRDELGVTVAIVGDELVLAAYPPAIEPHVRTHILGRELPARSLAHSDWLRTASRDHGLVPHLAGMVDLSRIAAILGGDGDPLSNQVVAAWNLQPSADPCTQAWRAVLDQAPRVWFGLRGLDARGIRSAWVWELGAGLRDELSPIAAPIAGLGRRSEGLAAVGVGIDAMAAYGVFERWRTDDRLGACWPDAADDRRGVPAWMVGLRGGSAVLHDWDLQLDHVTGVVVVGLDDPLEWLRAVGLGADDGPLRRGRRAVPIEDVLGTRKLLGDRRAWIARGPHALGVAVGARGQRALRRAVGAERDDGENWATWEIDLHGLVEGISPHDLDRSLGAMDPAERPWAEAAIDVLDRWDGRFALTDHGLEFSQTVSLRRAKPSEQRAR